MNPLLVTCFNNLEMTKKAVASALAQNLLRVEVTVINNGSTDGTREYLENGPPLHKVMNYADNGAPTRIANDALFRAFAIEGHQWVLVMPNDAVLPTNMYREMLRWPRGIVAASPTTDEWVTKFSAASAVSENTPMAVMLIRKWAWQAVMDKDGFFLDEGMFHYASDCDLALRMAACGIRGVQLDLQFYHYGSASWRTADPDRQRYAHLQADKDREFFKNKWGFSVDSPEYGRLAQDLNFKG